MLYQLRHLKQQQQHHHVECDLLGIRILLLHLRLLLLLLLGVCSRLNCVSGQMVVVDQSGDSGQVTDSPQTTDEPSTRYYDFQVPYIHRYIIEFWSSMQKIYETVM
jgi:hypothetical protein